MRYAPPQYGKQNDYKNGILQRVAQAEGALVLEQCPNCATNDPFIESNSNGIIMKWFYEYNLKDHLGNTRVTFKDKDNNWTIDPNTEISQINHYYPFGLNMEGNWNGAQGSNKYQYNGKEWNDDLGLGWNDYGARFYDPAIARWWAVDPLAEKYFTYSGYHYAVNNPIRFIDLDGRESYTYDWNSKKYKNSDGSEVSWSEVKSSLDKNTKITANIANVGKGSGGVTAILAIKFSFNLLYYFLLYALKLSESTRLPPQY